jgi:phosphatidate phosphatase PAH1
MMRALEFLSLSMTLACALRNETPVTEPMLPPDVNVGTQAVPDVRCTGTPNAGPATEWRHLSSELIVGAGDSHHRGMDLIATTDDEWQPIRGKITYGATDKDLEDEDVDLFACVNGAWSSIGTSRTNSDGRFTLDLGGASRLPAGMRDMYLSVRGDRTGARFLALVAPPGTRVIASDIDGTLTASENEYPTALAIGGDVAAQPDAPGALMSAAVRGVVVVYISSRGDRFTQDTRDWFAAKGFPRGPLHLPESIVTVPGADTVEFKTAALATLAPFDLIAGIGNRASDVAAYRNTGLPADRIFIKLPEFTSELTTELEAGNATGFEAYEALRTMQMATVLAN